MITTGTFDEHARVAVVDPDMAGCVPTGDRQDDATVVAATPVTVKFDPLVAVPDGVVTVIRPVVAPAGTVAVTRSSFTKLKLADVPLNRTLVAPVKWLPLMVTDVPTAPLDGEKLLIVGADPLVTVKFDALVAVPDGVVTVILPVVAPLGTLAVIRPSFATLKLADVPLNRTLVAPVKWLPLMVTDVPTAPLDGEKLLIVGAVPAGDREVRRRSSRFPMPSSR